jgi:hypothetical protein
VLNHSTTALPPAQITPPPSAPANPTHPCGLPIINAYNANPIYWADGTWDTPDEALCDDRCTLSELGGPCLGWENKTQSEIPYSITVNLSAATTVYVEVPTPEPYPYTTYVTTFGTTTRTVIDWTRPDSYTAPPTAVYTPDVTWQDQTYGYTL